MYCVDPLPIQILFLGQSESHETMTSQNCVLPLSRCHACGYTSSTRITRLASKTMYTCTWVASYLRWFFLYLHEQYFRVSGLLLGFWNLHLCSVQLCIQILHQYYNIDDRTSYSYDTKDLSYTLKSSLAPSSSLSSASIFILSFCKETQKWEPQKLSSCPLKFNQPLAN